MSGRYYVGVVPILCLPAFACYILGRVVDRGGDIPIESSIVHPLNVISTDTNYEEMITLFLMFLSERIKMPKRGVNWDSLKI